MADHAEVAFGIAPLFLYPPQRAILSCLRNCNWTLGPIDDTERSANFLGCALLILVQARNNLEPMDEY